MNKNFREVLNKTGKKNGTGLDILITTYPRNGSRNVGDALISDSAIKLIRFRVPEYDPMIVFRESSLDDIQGNIYTILAPGFSVNDQVYPNLFRLYDKFEKLPDDFYPVGCSFQHVVPKDETYASYRYSDETLIQLRSIVCRSGPLPCRDRLIVEMLNRNGIPAFYSGDLALYDDAINGTDFVPLSTVSSVAFTVQHKPKFSQQAFLMLRLIRKEFPVAKLYVVHHSKVNKNSKAISDYAKTIGYIERDLSGEVSNLDFYDEVDLHIGYRLHGHISFLRRRKPSCLLVEDSRAFGIAHTEALSIGTFHALRDDAVTVDKETPERVVKFVRTQVKGGFEEYRKVFKFIDKSYRVSVRPYFDVIAYRLGWRSFELRYFLRFLWRKANNRLIRNRILGERNKTSG